MASVSAKKITMMIMVIIEIVGNVFCLHVKIARTIVFNSIRLDLQIIKVQFKAN